MFEVGDWVVTTACPNIYFPQGFCVVLPLFHLKYDSDLPLIKITTGTKSIWNCKSFKRVCIFDIIYFKLKENYV